MGMGVHHVHVHLLPLTTESDVDPSNVYTARDDERIRVAEKVKEALV